MNHTGHLTFVFRLYRYAVAVIAHGNDGVLQIGAQGAVYHGIQLGMNSVVGDSHAAPDMFQGRACIVGNLLLGEDTAVNLVCNGRKRFQSVKPDVERIAGNIVPLSAAISLDTVYVFQKGGDA